MTETFAQAGSATVVAACCVAMYVLLLTSTFVMRGENVGQASHDADAGGDAAATSRSGIIGLGEPVSAERDLDVRLAQLAVAGGLSPREREVLALLARGRSIPCIRQELSIAESTAKTHSHRVYEKLGVHTKQELLDLIERRE